MKKVLIVSDVPTSPVVAGNRVCISAYSSLLKSFCDVYFLYISPVNNNEDYQETAKEWDGHFFFHKVDALQNKLNGLVYKHKSLYNVLGVDFFYPWFLCRKVRKLQEKYSFDGIIINYIWLSKIANGLDGVPIILFTHDVFTFRNKKLGYSHWITCTPNEEAKCINRVDYVLAIQEKECNYYQYLSYKSKVFTVYTPFFPAMQSITLNKNILFFSGDNDLNVVCMKRFATYIMPYLSNHLPGLVLHIGGKICYKLERYPEFVNKTNIVLHGIFRSPEDFYRLGDIVVNPVNEGTGLKIKTFEAISYGKTVIASHHSIDGVFNKSEIPVYIAEAKEDYLNIIKRCLCNKDELKKNQLKAISWLNSLNGYIAGVFKSII